MAERSIKVRCSVPNGIELRLFAEGHDDGTGHRPMRPTGDPVILRGPSSLDGGISGTGTDAVENEIPANFWQAWREQNWQNPLVTSGQIVPVEDRKADADGKS